MNATSCAARGLPRFTQPHELGPWRDYFVRVYGEAPPRYPLCVADFHLLYTQALPPLRMRRACVDADAPLRSVVPAKEPPWTLRVGIRRPPTPVPSDTWIEVTHRSRSWRSGFERRGMWFGLVSGSGVWIHTGRTRWFWNHRDAFRHFGATWENDLATRAAAQGVDTLQFLHCDGIPDACCRKLGMGPCCGGFEILVTRLNGTLACGGDTNAFRAGWHAEKPCVCREGRNRGSTADPADPMATYTHCEGYASHAQ
jgi:hypothetical protein